VSVSDPILVRVAAGDGTAVRACQDTFGGLVWSIARRMLGATAEAEDAVQEVFIELWRSAGRYDPERGTEVQFVATIARRRIIDRVRRLGVGAPTPSPCPRRRSRTTARRRKTRSS
jgi:RNA polymerase sigma-70 factor (ECF subfamily)